MSALERGTVHQAEHRPCLLEAPVPALALHGGRVHLHPSGTTGTQSLDAEPGWEHGTVRCDPSKNRTEPSSVCPFYHTQTLDRENFARSLHSGPDFVLYANIPMHAPNQAHPSSEL